MENNLSIYMEEVKQERYFQKVRSDKKRLAERKQNMKIIKKLFFILVCLLIYLSWRLI